MNLILSDLYRISHSRSYFILLKKILFSPTFRLLVLYRFTSHYKSFLGEKWLYFLGLKYGISIPNDTKIGEGLLLLHPSGITINSSAKIGNNFTILKGATIGNEKRGRNKGAPIIGNNVYVGMNASVVGNISIGDNVMIAPNSFVNMNIPDNSVVVGNPGVITKSQLGASGYIYNEV